MCYIFYPELISQEYYLLLETLDKTTSKICLLDGVVKNYMVTDNPFSSLSWLFNRKKHELFMHSLLNNNEFFVTLDASNLDIIIDDWMGYVDHIFVLYHNDHSHLPYVQEPKLTFKCTKIDLTKPVKENMILINKALQASNYETLINGSDIRVSN